MKIPAPVLGPLALLEAKKSNAIRISSTPFGAPLGQKQYYLGEAVPWKGVRKKPGEPWDAYRDRFLSIVAPSIGESDAMNILRGLETAISMSRKHKETGVAAIDIAGFRTVVPLKVAEMMIEAGRPVTIIDKVGEGISKEAWKRTYGSIPKTRVLLSKVAVPAFGAPR